MDFLKQSSCQCYHLLCYSYPQGLFKSLLDHFCEAKVLVPKGYLVILNGTGFLVVHDSL